MKPNARPLFIGALIAAALAVAPGTAHAQSVTSEEFRSLVDRADDDPAALAELRRVEEVDGRPMDVGEALAGAEGEELDARLEALGADETDETNDPAERRRAARAILSDRRYNPPDVPRPFEGLARRVGESVGRFLAGLADIVPGGSATLWFIAAAIVVALASVLTIRTARRRKVGHIPRPARSGEGPPEDARSLERAADDAERAGRHAEAIRLRFRAGLLRLDEFGVIEYSPSLTTSEVARTVRSKVFASLASTFEQVAYGGRPARRDDVEASRRGWALLRRDFAR